MQQFNLDIWLQDKSRKVTTRLGNREVRIICYDRKNDNNKPIITLMIDPDGNEYTTFHTKNGFVCETEKYIDKRDLFFADEEEELTEFEKTMIQFSHERNSLIQFEHTTEEINAHLHRYSEKLLAKKELAQDFEKSISTDIEQDMFDNMTNLQKCFVKMFKYADYHGMVNAIKQFSGLAEAIIKKDLPKWKKVTEHKNLEKHVAILEDGKVLLSNYLEEGDYYVDLEDLKTLPKEE